MILVTDGAPNVTLGGACDDDPNLWPDGGAPHDCGIYYAQKAADAGIVIYTVGLGVGVDSDFLQAIADETGGQILCRRVSRLPPANSGRHHLLHDHDLLLSLRLEHGRRPEPKPGCRGRAWSTPTSSPTKTITPSPPF